MTPSSSSGDSLPTFPPDEFLRSVVYRENIFPLTLYQSINSLSSFLSIPIFQHMISSASLKKLIRQKESVQIVAMSLYNINKALKETITIPNLPEPPDYEWLKSLNPYEHHSFLLLFYESIVNQLPPQHPYDHYIPFLQRRIRTTFWTIIFPCSP